MGLENDDARMMPDSVGHCGRTVNKSGEDGESFFSGSRCCQDQRGACLRTLGECHASLAVRHPRCACKSRYNGQMQVVRLHSIATPRNYSPSYTIQLAASLHVLQYILQHIISSHQNTTSSNNSPSACHLHGFFPPPPVRLPIQQQQPWYPPALSRTLALSPPPFPPAQPAPHPPLTPSPQRPTSSPPGSRLPWSRRRSRSLGSSTLALLSATIPTLPSHATPSPSTMTGSRSATARAPWLLESPL